MSRPDTEAPDSLAAPARPPGRRRLALIAASAAGGILTLALALYLLAPRVSIAGFEIEQTRDTHFAFILKLAVQNRLPIDVEVAAYSLALKINGEPIASNTSRRTIEIPGWEVTHVPVEAAGMENELPEYLQMGRRMAPMRRDYDYRLAGWIDLARPFHYRYNVDYRGTIEAFAMPDIMIEKIRMAKFDLFNPEMDLELEITNANGFPISQKDYEADVFINGIQVGRVKHPALVTYPAHEKTLVPFRIHAESIRAAAAAMRVLQQGGEVVVRVRGTLTVTIGDLGTFPFEFDKEGPAPVDLRGFGLPYPQP